MKNSIKTLAGLTCGLFLLQGCSTRAQSLKTAKSPSDYCYKKDGEVKSVNGGEELYCLLPSGEVIDLREYYSRNY